MLWFVWYYLNLMDTWKVIVPKDEGCIHMPGVPGAEDQTLWNPNVVLMSSAERYNLERELPDHISEGSIFMLAGF
jgi:hypothetical protein